MNITARSSKDAIITASQECLDHLEAQLKQARNQRNQLAIGALLVALLYLLPS